MNKAFLILILLAASFSVRAQKDIVFVTGNSTGTINIYGACPNTINASYYYNPENNSTVYGSILGYVLKKLGEEGFSVDQMNTILTSNETEKTRITLSRPSSNTPATVIQKVSASTDEEVKEVARYNLQGLPVRENEKGIQIIVYSNYTTKTIIKE